MSGAESEESTADTIAEMTGTYYRRLLKEMPMSARCDQRNALALTMQFQRLYVSALFGRAFLPDDEVSE